MVVSTPLDFDADGNTIGPVFVDVDTTSSDPQYAEAGRRTLAVVEVDAILNNLRVRRQENELELINDATGQVLRRTSLDEPGGSIVVMGFTG